jgi:pyridoxal 5'-phosphate synthase pdxT subunit
MTDYSRLHIGILAIQGDFERHEHQVRLLGATPHLVKLPADLDGIDGIIFPGGESTTMSIMMDRHGLRGPLLRFCKAHPTYGTCAGMIMLSKRIVDNQSGVIPLALVDIEVLRNGYGRQVFSFEETVEVRLKDGIRAVKATFIRAPKVASMGKGVETLAEFGGSPVLIRQGNRLASSFHTELEEDTTVLRYFLDSFFG